MAWWLAIPAVLSAISSISQSGQQSQNAYAAGSWSRYNAQMGYNNTLGNLRSQMHLSKFNAALSMRAGSAAASAAAGAASYNAQMIHSTALYNDSLLEEELRLMWSGSELEIEQIEKQRARERGDIIATQAASGTVIGVGSNEDVIVAQKTQEAMDAFIVRHGADLQAAKITNARTQGLWQGQAQIAKVLYEGRLGAASAMNNAKAQAAGGLAQAAIGGLATLTSARYRLKAEMAGADLSQMQGLQQSQNTLFRGLFNAAGQGVSAYYGAKVPDIGTALTTSGGAYAFPTSSFGATGGGVPYRPMLDYGRTPGETLVY